MLNVFGPQSYAKQSFNDDYIRPQVDRPWNLDDTGYVGKLPEVVVDPDHTEYGCMGWPTNRDKSSGYDDSDGMGPVQNNQLLVSHSSCLETSWGPVMTHIV